MQRAKVSARVESITERLVDKYARENNINRSDVIREALENLFSVRGLI